MIRVALRCVLLISLGLGLTGCFPAADSKLDDQKDPHYLNGRTRVSSLDYKGAIEEFEKALETNPRSASAHFELGLLFEEQMKDYAAAIYHYERHLQLRPNSEYAEPVRQRIKACKSDLVKTEFIIPVSQGMQRDLERLASENLQLKQEVEKLRAQLAVRSATVQTVPQSVAPPVVQTKPQVTQNNPVTQTPRTQTAPPKVLVSPKEVKKEPVASAPRRPKTYAVKSGDTVTGIAKQFNLKLNQLLSANPTVDARRLKVGQVLKIPAP